MISVDITLIIQIVNFLVSLWIINCLIIKPIRGNLMKRRSMVDADMSEAGKLSLSATIAVKEHDEVIVKVLADIASQKKTAKEDAENRAHLLAEESMAESRGIRNDASAKVKKESTRALKDLEAKIPEFAKNALEKVLN